MCKQPKTFLTNQKCYFTIRKFVHKNCSQAYFYLQYSLNQRVCQSVNSDLPPLMHFLRFGYFYLNDITSESVSEFFPQVQLCLERFQFFFNFNNYYLNLKVKKNKKKRENNRSDESSVWKCYNKWIISHSKLLSITTQ